MLSNDPKQEPSLYISLQDDVVAAAEAQGITVSRTRPHAWEKFEDEEDIEETPQMLFEDVIEQLEFVEGARQLTERESSLAVLVKNVASHVREHIEILREEHNLGPLPELERIEKALMTRAQELGFSSDESEAPG